MENRQRVVTVTVINSHFFLTIGLLIDAETSTDLA
jgi:hypothetical protein